MINAQEARELVIKYQIANTENTEQIITEKIDKFLDRCIRAAASRGRTNIAINEIMEAIESDTGITNYNKSNIFAALRELAKTNGFVTNRDLIEWG